jgi:hypothetical protein
MSKQARNVRMLILEPMHVLLRTLFAFILLPVLVSIQAELPL